jgi:copper homeostasis protein
MNYILETIAFNTASCHTAQALGVQRIELCANPSEGGTTPSYGFIKAARAILQIDLYPIIRPRGGDFLYNDDEFESMKEDILMCKSLGCDGVVIGMLNKDATIDKIRASKLVSLAYPMGVTFHRAFDRCIDANKALQGVIDIGCERILTSGFYPNVIDGLENIKSLISLANDDIIIMPGSGVRADNVAHILQYTGAKEIHSSARMHINSSMENFNATMQENLQQITLNEEEVRRMIEVMQSIKI